MRNLTLAFLCLLVPGIAFAASGGAHDPFTLTLLYTGAILLAAAIGRGIALAMKQPPVLGELLCGVIIGTLGYQAGFPFFVLVMHSTSVTKITDLMYQHGTGVIDAIHQVIPESEALVRSKLLEVLTDPHASAYLDLAATLSVFSHLGVILLLFMVGLESSVGEMKRVGKNALFVAIIGVVAPFLLSLAATHFAEPDLPFATHIFLAAALCATSVGITARVFKDMNFMQSVEAKTVLGAAVIDDILGLIILAVVVGVATTGEFSLITVGTISLSSLLFLGTTVLLGERAVQLLVPLAAKVDPKNAKLLVAILMAFGVSYLAAVLGLASIVGAFAAGLIIKDEFFEGLARSHERVEELVAPLEKVFAPVFFVLMGMQVDVISFLDTNTLVLALIFTVAGIVGKLVSGLGASADTDRYAIGLAMIPRGEVGLIFASIGLSIGVVSGSSFSALVCMVVLTTFLTPIFLGKRLKKLKSS